MAKSCEEWRLIQDAELPKCFVSDKGRIYNIEKKKLVNVLKKNATGYFYANFWIKDSKKSVKRYVHRLVADGFIPNPEGKPYVDHINTDKSNNCVENLRWVTAKENAGNELTRKHMSEKHADIRGEKNPFYGRKHSDETKDKIRKGRMGADNPCFGRTGEKHPMFGKPSATKGKKRYFNDETQRFYYA